MTTTVASCIRRSKMLTAVLSFEAVIRQWLAALPWGDTAQVDVLAERLRAQLLSGSPASSPGEVVERLLAVQAQDLVAARLGVRARSTGLTAAAVDRALNERELVVSWLNRGTLHLVRAEDFAWLHAITTPQLATSNRTRLRQEGVDEAQADHGVEVVRAELTQGPRTRTALRHALAAAGIPVRGQAAVHVLVLATLRGVCVRGPVVGREQAFVLVADWLPDLKQMNKEMALRELGRRYLPSHAPATDRDLAKWAGIPLAAARQALRNCSTPTPIGIALPRPRLLGMFDELLMGWASRDPVLGEHSDLVTSNGMFRAVMLIGGRAVGTWTRRDGRIQLEPFEPLSDDALEALTLEAADVERFLGLPAARVRS